MWAGVLSGRLPETVRRYGSPLLLLALAAILVAQQVRDLVGFSSRYTDEDQTLLWLAGRELLDGHLRTPNFWGQNYLTVFETIPGQILHLIGLPLHLSDPFGAALIVTAAWLVIAWAAYRRGALGSAVLALGLPVVLSLDYLLCFDQLSGVLAGDLLAAIAVAAVVTVRRPALRLGLVIALTGVAFQWENASALASGPALAAALTLDWRALREDLRTSAIAIAAGLMLPAAWFVYFHLWYSAHPGAVVQPSPPLGLSFSVLAHNLAHPGALLSYFTPELFKHAWVAQVMILGLVLTAIAATFRYRRLAPAAVGLAFLVVLLVVLSTQDTRSNYEANLYLAGSRFLLPMPFGAWLVAFCVFNSAPATAPAQAISPQPAPAPDAGAPATTTVTADGRLRIGLSAVLGLFVVLALISAGVAEYRFDANRTTLLQAEAAPFPIAVDVESTASLDYSCANAATLSERHRTQIMVSADRTLTYACSAESGIDSIYPTHDRRVWVIDQALTRPVSRLLLAGGYSCTPGVGRTGRCTALPDGFYLLVTPRRPLAASLVAMGIGLYHGEQLITER